MADRVFSVSWGKSRKETKWSLYEYSWDQIKDMLSRPVRTPETYKAYMALSSDRQGSIKDVGGLVCGVLKGGVRSKKTIVSRSVVTLDVDFADMEFFNIFKYMFPGYAACVHGTHKHSKDSPRLRLAIPLSRDVTSEEYGAVSRFIASLCNIEMFDKTTFQPERIMYLPSISRDSEYYYEEVEGKFLSPDDVLATYEDWRDITSWPKHKDVELRKPSLVNQQNPLEKTGIVGSFCRAYSITEAISEFLSHLWVEEEEDRYSYEGSSTRFGGVVYDNKFFYSHHAADPHAEKLLNAFDLVRCHLYGDDKDSFNKMTEMCQKDRRVLDQAFNERTAPLLGLNPVREAGLEAMPKRKGTMLDFYERVDWGSKLEVDKNLKVKATEGNILSIFLNDDNLKDAFVYNSFTERRYVIKQMPWRDSTGVRLIDDADMSGIRSYFGCVYGITADKKIDDAINLVFLRNSYDPLTEYLESLEWDGVPRIESIFQKSFGAEDTIYTREVAKKFFVGAVGRALNPGIKFDYVTVLAGEEGTGKSTFFSKIGKSWFSDTFGTFEGKESFEQIQGSWIIEWGELSALDKKNTEKAKHFITKVEDKYRPPYGRNTMFIKRRCVFGGTTNKQAFLYGTTGNRRFLPINVNKKAIVLPVFSRDFDAIIDQLWAEAVALYKTGESLYLSKEIEDMAKDVRENRTVFDDRRYNVIDFLESEVPQDYETMPIATRVNLYRHQKSVKDGVKKTYVCVRQVICECFGKSLEQIETKDTREITELLYTIPGWQITGEVRDMGEYGKCRIFKRVDK